MEHALEAYKGTTLIFHSDGKWLYPLFELEAFLEKTDVDPAQLTVHDKIVGRAAALLMIHLNLGKIYAQVLSQPGQEVLEHHRLPYRYEQLVESITCQTEHLLKDEYDPESAYVFLQRRAKQ